MELEMAAARLAELGHSTRLAIFRILVKAGRQGVSVGDIQQQLDIPGSTLSHHLARMIKVDLLQQRREGRTLYCQLQFAVVEALLGYLYAECCAADGQPLLTISKAALSSDRC
ncbi:ArsR/SmtB family transcription factor [Arsukibacterium perlucidum]|uniref:ArsR/SmtB family transcription factor n=1 Tax=Arsukibacterium perlucidum TaxID=368811 RepID=UPI000380BA02|nr:metalloregulator ArsR/SmtB family transcription factor [Arsukibacterium perlucidum]